MFFYITFALLVFYFICGMLTMFVIHFYNKVDYTDFQHVKTLMLAARIWPFVVSKYLIATLRRHRQRKLENSISSGKLPFFIGLVAKTPTQERQVARREMKKIASQTEQLSAVNNQVTEPVTGYGWE